MPPETSAVADPTIVTQPPAPAPVAPEKVVYPDPVTPPVVPPVTPTPADPAKPEPVTPPATPPADPKTPTEPAKPEGEKPTTPTPADYTLKPPAGSLVSEEEAKALTEKAKKAGMTEDQAKGLLQERADAKMEFKTTQDKQLADAKTQWLEQSKNDPEFGGEKLAEFSEKGSRIINRYAPELVPLLNESGLGNHPAVFKFLARLSTVLSEDQLVRGTTGAAPDKKSPEEILYGKTTPGVQA